MLELKTNKRINNMLNQKAINEAIELHKHRPIKTKRHYIYEKEPIRSMMTIETYIRQHKTFSLKDFTVSDIKQISLMIEGYFIVNNCKIPVCNGTLMLNQLTSRFHNTYSRVKLTVDEIKQSRKDSQKRYVKRQKDISKGIIDKDEKDSSITFTSHTSIFRDYAKKQKAYSVKRLITAKRDNEYMYIPDMFYEECNRPIVKKTSYQNIIDMCSLPFEHEMINRVFVTTQNNYNKHYQEIPLYLKSNDGTLYQYGKNNVLEKVKIEG